MKKYRQHWKKPLPQILLTVPAKDWIPCWVKAEEKFPAVKNSDLSIARALLRKPRLLIFDEATSALDSLTEEQITETVKEISALKQQITILIAHRLSTIMHADTIYVLEKGKIVEQGSHDELVDKKGLYYAMWRQQIGERKTVSRVSPEEEEE